MNPRSSRPADDDLGAQDAFLGRSTVSAGFVAWKFP